MGLGGLGWPGVWWDWVEWCRVLCVRWWGGDGDGVGCGGRGEGDVGWDAAEWDWSTRKE